jgi:hypothetical protein
MAVNVFINGDITSKADLDKFDRRMATPRKKTILETPGLECGSARLRSSRAKE